MPWMPNDTTEARWLAMRNATKIGKWPGPSEKRSHIRFRMLHVEGVPFPIAARYISRIFPFLGSNEDFFGFIDVDWVDGPDHLFGTTGLSNEGRELTLTITQYDPGVDPIFGDRGIMFDWTYQIDGGGISHFYDMWSVDIFGDYNVPYRPFDLGVTPNWLRSDTGPVAPTDWTGVPIQNNWHWITQSECYILEQQIPPAPGGFAELNGVDSDVIFDNRTDWNGARFYLEFDIRNNEDLAIVVLGKTFNTTQYFGFNGQYAFWNGYLTDMGEILTLDTWIHVRFEWAWTAEDSTYRVFWDGAPKGTLVGALRFNQFDTIGKKGPAFIGHFDLKNLIYKTGTPASPTTLLDMELINDACDAGPDLIKGTTTNMALPSCP